MGAPRSDRSGRGRVLAVASVVSALGFGWGAPVAGQGGNPSVHFGASTLPDTVVGVSLGLALDRFTPFAAEGDGRIPYNDIRRTIGFNMVHASVVKVAGPRGLRLRATAQAGWGHNQPTEWIQDRLHALVGFAPVETVDPRNHAFDAAVSLEAILWGVLIEDGFVGAGASAGTPYAEGWVYGGASTRVGARGPRLSSVLRLGWARGGAVFPSETLAGAYASIEGRVDLPVHAWLDRTWIPDVFVAVTQDSGFFADSRLGARPERNGTFGFTDRENRWSVEFWNEYFGGRFEDIGPTGGGRVTVRVGGS